MFTGNRELSERELRRAIESARIEGQMWSDPSLIEQALLMPIGAAATGRQGQRRVPRFTGNRAELPVTIVGGRRTRSGNHRQRAARSAERIAVDLTAPLSEGRCRSPTAGSRTRRVRCNRACDVQAIAARASKRRARARNDNPSTVDVSLQGDHRTAADHR